jgi:ketosteroid isomerase-like protein
VRHGYEAYNAALSAPNPREAIRAWLERFFDPEIEWDLPASVVEQRTFHGIDGVMEMFDQILEGFEQIRQVPKRFIDCGDQVLVIVRTEARGRIAGLDVNEEWAHLITIRDGKRPGSRCSGTVLRPSKPPGCGSRRRRRGGSLRVLLR